jgi:hypothetical protein
MPELSAGQLATQALTSNKPIGLVQANLGNHGHESLINSTRRSEYHEYESSASRK